MMEKQSDIKIYCSYMEDIKKRIHVVRSFFDNDFSFGSEMHDYEVVCLQVRKILELVVFANLAANKNQYSKVHKDFAQKWSAKRLLSSIEKINSEFYPKPVNPPKVLENGVKHFEDFEGPFLSKDNWLKLYDLCSQVLHVWNPYKQKDTINFEKNILDWVQDIQNLLNIHYIRLPNSENVWLVIMSYEEDGKVHAFSSQAVD